MKARLAALILFLCCSTSLPAVGRGASYPDSDSTYAALATFVKNVSVFNRILPQENVYLHFDNTAYYLEEQIFFQAYVVRADTHTPDAMSRILYVELLNPQGHVRSRLKLKVREGRASGSFTLPKDWSPGYYEIRAYTRAMLNWDETTIFSRVLPVFTQPDREGHYEERDMTPKSFPLWNDFRKRQQEDVEMSFYPEGGDMVVGLPSHVAFQIEDADGWPMAVKGELCHEKVGVVVPVSTVSDGRGSVCFTPAEPGEYCVTVTEQDGKSRKTLRFELPQARREGYSLIADNTDEEFLDCRLYRSPGMPVGPIGMIVSCRGRVCLFDTLSVKDSSALRIPKRRLPAGVCQLTLFSQEGEILAERLFFVHPPEAGKKNALDLAGLKESYESCERIPLTFTGPPLCSFSVSVRDKDTETPVYTSESMATRFLLSSDLKGYIAYADRYLADREDSTATALDMLMLTQGWRRYDWQQMAGIKSFELKHYTEDTFGLDGRILQGKEKPYFRKPVNILVKDKKNVLQYTSAMTDEKGYFSCALKEFQGKYDMVLSTPEEKTLSFRVDRVFKIAPRIYGYYETRLRSMRQEATARKKTKSVTEVQELEAVSVSAKDRRNLRYQEYDIDRYKEDLRDLGETYGTAFFIPYLIETCGYQRDDRNPGIMLNGAELMVLYHLSGRFKGKGPVQWVALAAEESRSILVYEDNYAHLDVAVKESPFSKISSPFLTVLIIPYNEESECHYMMKNIRRTYMEGYSSSKAFRHRDYSKKKLERGEMDHRRTLYWNPDLKTDDHGRATIEFYNNSTCRHLTISAEGLSPDGQILVLEK